MIAPLLLLFQWLFVIHLGSCSSIRTYNLGEDSLTLENNNNSVVIEVPTNSKFILKDSSNNILYTTNKIKNSLSINDQCKKPASCEPLQNQTCLGVRLPYAFTTLNLVPDLADQQEVQDRLKKLQGLRYIPKCWAVIQSFLCALYLPKCEDNSVSVPSHEICKILSGPCRIVASELAAEFNCHQNGTKPSRSCKNEGRDLKFNSTSQCKLPLVTTEVISSFYPGVEGCGVQCYDPLYSKEEHGTIQTIIRFLAFTCFVFIILSLLTLGINRKATSMYFTSRVISYINICFLVVCIGCLVQFVPGINKEDIVCQKDGTLRVSGSRFDFCTGTFVIIYWSLIAGLVWFVILTYIIYIKWHEKTGKIHERIRKKIPWFHIGAWAGVPLPLIIIICWIGEIDGNSVSGICFVGYNNIVHRILFFSLPVFCALTVGNIFLIKGLFTLTVLKSSSEEVMSKEDFLKVTGVFQRIRLFTILVDVISFPAYLYPFYEFFYGDSWKASLRDVIVCGFGVGSDVETCHLTHKPNASYRVLQFFAMFTTAVVISSYWVLFTKSFMQSWCSWFKRLIRKEKELPVSVPKHKLVSRAYAKIRKATNLSSRLSVDFYETPQDPIGLNFELNSKASLGMSATWLAAFPNLLSRRNALREAVTDMNSNSSSKQNSEISYSVCRVSVESRRNSNDSSVSVQALEVTKTVRKSRDRRGNSRKTRRDMRSSSTSQESFFRWMQVLAQSSGPEPPTSSRREPMARREAIADLDNNVLLLTSHLFGQLDNDQDDVSSPGSESDHD